MPAKRKPLTPSRHFAKRQGSVIAPADRERAWCVKCDEPTPSVMCETVRGVGIAFYHYCAACWHKPAADGGPSAAQRTGVDLPDALDFEARWLAECRAHGETRRRLIAAQHELGDHSDCGECEHETSCPSCGSYDCQGHES